MAHNSALKTWAVRCANREINSFRLSVELMMRWTVWTVDNAIARGRIVADKRSNSSLLEQFSTIKKTVFVNRFKISWRMPFLGSVSPKYPITRPLETSGTQKWVILL